MAVADDKGRGDSALAPFAPANVPAVEVARDLHLLADGPKGTRAEVQFNRTEPVPAAGHGLAHGDVQAGQRRLLSGIRTDRLRESENDRLAYAHGDAGARENAGRNR
jgi:hypothetical protein